MRTTLERHELREWVTLENEGQRMFGMLHRPQQCANPPVVVIFHGFASSKCGSNRCYVTLAEKFAQAGLATLRFDFRGSGDSEGSLSKMTFEDLVSDAVIILKTLKTFENIDWNRVALFGASLGGTLSILAAAHTHNVKTLVLWAPVASGQLWYRDFLVRHPEKSFTESESVFSSYKGIKLHPEFITQFAEMSAYSILAQQLGEIPTLHMQGEEDPVISIAHQNAFRQACQQRSHVQFVKYQDSQHSLGFSPLFPMVIENTLSWLKTHL